MGISGWRSDVCSSVLRLSYAPSQAAIGHDDSLYLAADLSAGIPTTPLTLSASAGYTDGGLAALAPSGHYWDWSLGASASFGRLTAGIKYVDTDIPTTGDRKSTRLNSSH